MDPVRLPGASSFGTDVDHAIDVAYARGFRNGWQQSLSAVHEMVMKRATKSIAVSAILRDIEQARKVVGNG